MGHQRLMPPPAPCTLALPPLRAVIDVAAAVACPRASNIFRIFITFLPLSVHTLITVCNSLATLFIYMMCILSKEARRGRQCQGWAGRRRRRPQARAAAGALGGVSAERHLRTKTTKPAGLGVRWRASALAAHALEQAGGQAAAGGRGRRQARRWGQQAGV